MGKMSPKWADLARFFDFWVKKRENDLQFGAFLDKKRGFSGFDLLGGAKKRERNLLIDIEV